MSVENNKLFIRRYLDAINGKNKTPALINEFVTDVHLKEHILTFETAFPRYEMTLKDVFGEGNRVAVRAVLHGTHRGPLMEIPPTGRNIEVAVMAIFEVENDKITDHWLLLDNARIIRQLGVMMAHV